MWKIGYTQGVFDMFHIGHLNLINNAKAQCEKLIVGVNSDELVREYKNRMPVIREEARAEIIRNLKSVDECVIVSTLDKVQLYDQYKFDVVFIGDDWKGSNRWNKTEEELKKNYGINVIYLPHTPDISSTILRDERENSIDQI